MRRDVTSKLAKFLACQTFVKSPSIKKIFDNKFAATGSDRVGIKQRLFTKK